MNNRNIADSNFITNNMVMQIIFLILFIMMIIMGVNIPAYSQEKPLTKQQQTILNNKEIADDIYRNKRIMYGLSIAPVPFVRNFGSSTGNSFGSNCVGLSIQAGAYEAFGDKMPLPISLIVDAGVLTYGMELASTSGSWWGNAGDMLSGNWYDILIETPFELSNKIRPFIFIGYSMNDYYDINDQTMHIKGEGTATGAGINLFFGRGINLFYRFQYNNLKWTPVFSGVKSTAFAGYSTAHYFGLRITYYFDPYASILHGSDNDPFKKCAECDSKNIVK